jgi:hypothetical protein
LRRSIVLLAFALVLCPFLPLGTAYASPVTASIALPDFDGDGFADLAVGIEEEDVGPTFNAGAVSVLYGSDTGLSAAGDQLWTQASREIEGKAGTSDAFGAAVAPADFDGDGFTDLAIGVPNDPVGPEDDAGRVAVLYGGQGGLSAVGDQLWSQNSPGILDASGADENFGEALAAADFDGDGFADLAVGVPEEDFGDITTAGAVNVLYGSAVGLTGTANQFWHQNQPGIAGEVEETDAFGQALASGDFDADGFADVAAGVPGESLSLVSRAGSVAILYGGPVGLSAAGDQFWSQDNPDILDLSEESDAFGSSLSAADFDGDLITDLAVGVPTEDVEAVVDAGAVNVLYGSGLGLSAEGNQFWTQDSIAVLGESEATEDFGNALASADFDADGFADLAVGVPDEGVGLAEFTGAVNVLYGFGNGLTAVGNQFWSQDTPGILDVAEDGDEFGGGLAATDFNGDGYADLAVGVPHEDVGGASSGGAVNGLYGTGSGLSSALNQFWTQDSPGMLDLSEDDDGFGSALSG